MPYYADDLLRALVKAWDSNWPDKVAVQHVVEQARVYLATPAAPGIDVDTLKRLPPATCYRTHLGHDEHLGISGAVWIADVVRAYPKEVENLSSSTIARLRGDER
jgi:hypothetical protein